MMDFWLQQNDLQIVSGDFILCPTDTHVIAQAITIRLKTLADEWFLDTTLGIPYFTEIFGQKRSERFIRQLILPEIEAVPGIHQVKDFIVKEEPNRKLSISFTAMLSDGAHFSINESIGV